MYQAAGRLHIFILLTYAPIHYQAPGITTICLSEIDDQFAADELPAAKGYWIALYRKTWRSIHNMPAKRKDY